MKGFNLYGLEVTALVGDVERQYILMPGLGQTYGEALPDGIEEVRARIDVPEPKEGYSTVLITVLENLGIGYRCPPDDFTSFIPKKSFVTAALMRGGLPTQVLDTANLQEFLNERSLEVPVTEMGGGLALLELSFDFMEATEERMRDPETLAQVEALIEANLQEQARLVEHILGIAEGLEVSEDDDSFWAEQ